MIYGTQDSLFSSESAQAVAGLEQMRIVPVPNGNHVLEVSNTLDSLDVLKEIASIYKSFFDGVSIIDYLPGACPAHARTEVTGRDAMLYYFCRC